MPSSAEDFLSIAKDLISKSDDEERVRTSISRSYYSAYHLCRTYQGISEDMDLVGGKGGVHQKLIDIFKHSSKPSERGIAYILIELKGKRVLADYKISLNLELDDAQASINTVESLFEKLKKA